ncbi:unnamed protein product [Ilex paraguariensis]|uniref:Uncharacterized protein n=1 Tax=Ilex paraguariensis TaxID=185542 RepID=A0ABC8TLB2_9AQUA
MWKPNPKYENSAYAEVMKGEGLIIRGRIEDCPGKPPQSQVTMVTYRLLSLQQRCSHSPEGSKTYCTGSRSSDCLKDNWKGSGRIRMTKMIL